MFRKNTEFCIKESDFVMSFSENLQCKSFHPKNDLLPVLSANQKAYEARAYETKKS